MLEAAVHRHSFIKKFNALREAAELQIRCADPVALLEHMHDPGGDPEQKDHILRSLTLVAQSKAPEAEAAMILMHLALWPGLDHARGRLWRFFHGDPDELTAAISAEFTHQIGRLRLDMVNRIAATIVRNVERDVRRQRIRELSRQSETDAYDDDLQAASSGPCELSLLTDIHDHDDLKRLEARVARLIGEDAALVIEIAVCGAPQREAAERFGLSHDAARKRYQRALARLRTSLPA